MHHYDTTGTDDMRTYTMDRERTDSYLLFSLADAHSPLEIRPKRGLFEGFQESEVQDPDSYMK